MNHPESYDIIIVGGGHAAAQAAHVASLMKLKTLIVTPSIDTIGLLSCNVSMGGVARSNLMYEHDALGASISSHCADLSATNLSMLNLSKGPAMHSLHAVLDKALFKSSILSFLQKLPHVTIFQQMVDDVIIENNKVAGVKTVLGINIRSKSVILCAGTFLNGKMHVGMDNFSGGRAGENASISLAERLKELKLPQGRMKTGTPPRIDGRSIDFSKITQKWGDGVTDGNLPVFSLMGNKNMHPEQLPCWITRTNTNTHDILRTGFDRSPFIQQHFEGKGPRYCPSIEDKITRFADKDSHQIILEPEGHTTTEFYPNGISTSLPFDVQIKAIQSIEGLENAIITRPGYAIEYDYYDPISFKQTLEFKEIENLYIAGTPLGTSGYVEAQCTGTVAAINCCLKIKGMAPWVPQRHEAYMGVLIDDITTKGVSEPYRMLTSRAEHRLSLSQGTADQRLTPIGRQLGLIDDARWEHFCRKQEAIAKIQEQLKSTWVNPKILPPQEAINVLGAELKQEANLGDLIKRPGVTYDKLALMAIIKGKDITTRSSLINEHGAKLADEIVGQVETLAKYEGYIKLQKEEVNKMNEMAHIQLPNHFDYDIVPALSSEIKHLLNKHQPETLGQASRINGITSVAISTVLVYLKKNKLLTKQANFGEEIEHNEEDNTNINPKNSFKI